jgi:putative peptidoglycan lipid II flippase
MSSTSSAALGKKIAQSTGIVMASVLLSRVLGLAREWVVAHQAGASGATDAYYTAFTLPDIVSYMLAVGSLSVTFIPVFSKYMAEKNEEEGWRVFSIVIMVVGVLLALTICVCEVFAPQICHAIAPGFKAGELAELTYLTRLMLPAQLFFFMGGVLSAVQYAKGQFVVPSIAPLVYNAGIIVGGILLSARIGMRGFAVGVLVGAFLGHFLLQVYGAGRAGARFTPSFAVRHPGFKLFVKLAVPIMLALSLSFTDDWIMRWFGSFLLPASISWLAYAKRLMQVPLAMMGQAIGIASFPVMAQLYSEKRFEELNDILNTTVKGLIVLLVPVAALTIAQSVPLVHLVYSHTHLGAGDMTAIAACLVWFSAGMFAWGAQNILARAFYATHDTITPAVVGTLLTGAMIPIYRLLMRHSQHIGLAMASSIGISVYTIALFVLLVRRTKDRGTVQLLVFFGKAALASAVAAIACRKFLDFLGERIAWTSARGAFVDLCATSALGFLIFFGLAHLLGIHELTGYLRKATARLARAVS